jgi:peptidoglycan/LPS O-acetylase OafA/YrhL
MKNNHIEGIDYLRAIMSIFVVVWHMGGGGRSLIFSKDKYLEHVFTVSDFVNFHMLLLAVPTFIFISNFLYALGGMNNTTLRKRLKRILILLTFWPIALIIFRNGHHGLLNLLPHSLRSFAVTVLTAGHTIYFFFVSLIVCLLITHLIAKLKLRLQLFGFVLSIIILSSMPELARMSDFYPLSAYWSPLNFIPFPFAAVLVAQNIDYVRLQKTILMSVLIVLFVLFSTFEWNYSVGGIFFLGQGHAIPTYTRTSLLFGVIALAIMATEPRIKSNSIIKYMGKYSLALYCLHPFLMQPVKKLVAKIVQNEMILTYWSIILVILFSYAIATGLRMYYLKEEVIT